MHVKQRFHADPIPSQKQSPAFFLPHGEGIYAIHMVNASFPKLCVCMEQNFRIRIAVKLMSQFHQFLPKFCCIVKLPIIHQNIPFIPIVQNHGLFSVHRIDHRQTTVEQAAIILPVNSIPIRAPATHGRKHTFRNLRICRQPQHPGNSTHSPSHPFQYGYSMRRHQNNFIVSHPYVCTLFQMPAYSVAYEKGVTL